MLLFSVRNGQKATFSVLKLISSGGASQGDYEQGVFFATTSFSQGAIDASINKGAIPIVLVNGDMIVDLMIGKQFGVETETLVIPIMALDLALTPDLSNSQSETEPTSKKGLSRGKSR